MAQPSDSRPVAIANYDLRASGTVLKSIEIAEALAAAGIPAELWVIRARGALKARVPPGLPVIEVGKGIRMPGGREIQLGLHIPALAFALNRRPPAVLLSGGNHFHLPAKMALRLSGRRKTVRLGLRASNSSRRPTGMSGKIRRPGRLDRIKYSGADFIAAVSSELADEVRSLGVAGEISAIPNGIDLERVRHMAEHPFDHPFLGGRPVLASVGRLVPQKGFDLAIRALALLPGIRLLVIGEGKRAELDGLVRLAESLFVRDRVDFLGFQPNPIAIIARCDAYVSASRWEGASNSLLEALAVGLPLVATDAPTGNREILGDGRNGTLAPVEDAAALAAAIETELALGRDRDAQRRAAGPFDIALCLADWVELLGEQRRLVL